MRHLPIIGSVLVGLSIVPALYLGLLYSRGQTFPGMPRWMVPVSPTGVVRLPDPVELVEPIQVAVLAPPKSIQARAGKLK
jgi:hypothetical protein